MIRSFSSYRLFEAKGIIFRAIRSVETPNKWRFEPVLAGFKMSGGRIPHVECSDFDPIDRCIAVEIAELSRIHPL
jgi:hypothetical protein